MATVVKREQCPSCAAKGQDNTGDNLARYDNGGAYCFSCGYFEGDGKVGGDNDGEPFIFPVSDCVKAFASKGKVTEEVLNQFGVKLRQHDDGRLFVTFPIVDVNGVEESFQYREYNPTLGKLGERKNAKGAKLKNPIFGWGNITEKTQKILVCEGQTDALVAATALAGTRDLAVVGIAGAGMAKAAAAQFVRYCENVTLILAFDNDVAGQEGRATFAEYVSQHSSTLPLFKLTLDAGVKDLCEFKGDFRELLAEATPMISSSLADSSKIADDLLKFLNTIESGDHIQLKFSPTLNARVKLLPGHLVGIVGNSGMGKSTFAEHIILEAMTQDRHTLFISAEMTTEEVGMKLMRTVTGEDYYDTDVIKKMDDGGKNALHKKTKNLLSRLFMMARFGKCTVADIDKRIHELIAAGAKPEIVVVDHFLAIASSVENSVLVELARDLKLLAEAHKVTVIILCHIRKPPKETSRSKRTLYKPTQEDAYGGSLDRNCDIMFGVATDQLTGVTYVETIKLPRLGAKWTEVQYQLVDFQYVEMTVDAESKVSYSEDTQVKTGETEELF